ncbi:Copper resistance lipoprotein NlpE [gut metagenome]|uniref:Copper resistance lipoprotein NlpE n=1 Tax=gut metagenome TaxID=749906 RepID=J9GT89_9ZZZZ
MKKNHLIAAAALFLSLAACNNAPKKEAATPEVVPAMEITPATPATPSLFGTFEGTLPAADCEGIQTTLTVNADSTYTLKSEYLGVKDGLFEASGVYNLLDNAVIELITPSSGEKTYYKRLESGYMLSDSLGTVNEGELAEHYILKQK